MAVTRIQVGDRMSQAVVYNGTVATAGQVALSKRGDPVAEQTKDVLARIDSLLAEAGTDKSKALTATIWLADMGDFAAMNAVWDAWITPGHPPTRACVQAQLASPDFAVEIALTAAVD